MAQAPFIETKPVPLVNPDLKSDPEMSKGLTESFNDFFSKAAPPSPEEAAEAEAAPPPEEQPVDEYAVEEDVPELPKPKEPAPKAEKKEEKKPEAKKPEEKPKELPKEEKKEAPKVDEKKPEAKAEPKPEPEEEDPDGLHKIQLGPNAKPETRKGFDELKAKVTAYRTETQKTKAELDAIRKEVEARDKQLEELRKAPAPPEVQQRLTDAEKRAAEAEHRIKMVDLENDRDFKAEHDDKIMALYREILDEAVRLKGNSPEIRQWADQLYANVHPSKLDREWWKKGVVSQFEDEDDRSEQNERVKRLLGLQRIREKTLEDFRKDPSKLQKYEQDKYQHYWGQIYAPQVTQWASAEAPKLLGDWAVRKDPSKASNDDERKAIEEHNKNYEAFEGAMKDYILKMNDPGDTKPQSHAFVALQAVKAIKLQQDVDRLTKELEGRSTTLKTTEETMKAELEASKAEVERLQGELDKVTRARSAIAKAPGTVNKPAGKGNTAKLNQSSHDAINEFFANR